MLFNQPNQGGRLILPGAHIEHPTGKTVSINLVLPPGVEPPEKIDAETAAVLAFQAFNFQAIVEYAVNEAVLAEREACAKLIEGHPAASSASTSTAVARLAEAIRQRVQPEEVQ
jgi:hypothetical protein